MPNSTAFVMPEDAFEKASAKGTDFYADMTDAEREEEGLPPREDPKPKPEPAADPEPEPAPAEEPEEEEEEEEDEPAEDSAAGRLFDEIAGMREDLSIALGKTPGADPANGVDPLLAAALDSDDPEVRGLAEQLSDAKNRLGQLEADAKERRNALQLEQDDKDFGNVLSSYTIGGEPLTEKHRGKVENYILENPEVGKRLSIEELTRVVFPSAVKSGPRPAPSKRAADRGGSPAATIVTDGNSGGAPEGPWKPRANETVESAVAAAGRAFGWKR